MKLKTGYGYFEKNGKKLEKFELSPGEHPDPSDASIRVVELDNKAALDRIVLDKTDKAIEHEQQVKESTILQQNAWYKIAQVAGLTPEELKAISGV